VQLEVFKTQNCGWGVRAAQDIPQNTFIAEYSGEILSHDEAEARKSTSGKDGNDSYFLETETLDELHRRFPADGSPGEDFDTKYVLDAKRFGNVARFFNGSCSPNVRKEKVIDRNSEAYPVRLAFYAKREIKKGEELCWNYEYNKTTQRGSLDHHLTCYCGALNCQGVLY
jgi:SET domain-containing protein